MQAEGWRRLWELLKWLIAIAAGIWSASKGVPILEAQAAKTLFAPGQMMLGLIIFAAVPGAIIFGFLSALEWVCRGFRPLSDIAPLAESVEAAKAAPAIESPPALPRLTSGQERWSHDNGVVIHQDPVQRASSQHTVIVPPVIVESNGTKSGK